MTLYSVLLALPLLGEVVPPFENDPDGMIASMNSKPFLRQFDLTLLIQVPISLNVVYFPIKESIGLRSSLGRQRKSSADLCCVARSREVL